MLNLSLIEDILQQRSKHDPSYICDILAKAKEAQGLTVEDVAVLSSIQNHDLLQELFATAEYVKDKIYGNRLVLFAPLYISNLCNNECLYCAFRATNKAIQRRSLSLQEVAQEARHLVEQGQKRLLLVAGESYSRDGFRYILDAIKTIYDLKSDHGEIRRINVNIAPLSLEDFKLLHAAEIGTYQLFQETYHPEVYKTMHVAGKKADYNWRLTAIDRAMEAGIDDVGIGVLFGLADWRFEILALLQHIQYLEQKFGVGPHTISVPRLEPAVGSEVSCHPPHQVTDDAFRKIIAILRLAVPFTGLILSTRETADMRRESLGLGISQISAASRTNPGGYSESDENSAQFSLGDHRSLDEVVADIAKMNYIPSFCTACYRLGRTGESFMQFAKSGKIKNMCVPNAIITFAEYLTDYASPQTREIGQEVISRELAKMPEQQRKVVTEMLNQIKNGIRDIFV